MSFHGLTDLARPDLRMTSTVKVLICADVLQVACQCQRRGEVRRVDGRQRIWKPAVQALCTPVHGHCSSGQDLPELWRRPLPPICQKRASRQEGEVVALQDRALLLRCTGSLAISQLPVSRKSGQVRRNVTTKEACDGSRSCCQQTCGNTALPVLLALGSQ